jgi:hypothetical protein
LLLCLNFAYIIQLYESTGLFLFKVELGYLPRMLFDWQARIRIKAIFRNWLFHIQAQAFAKRKAKAIAFVRAFFRQIQQKYEKQANRLHKPIDWQTKDKIYVRKGNWITDRFFDGLNNPYLGSYKILNNFYPNVYEIDFFLNIRARGFLNANRPMKARDNVMPGQILIFSDLVEINDKLK